MTRYYISLCLFACSLLFISDGHCRRGWRFEITPEEEAQEGPWFTGPLLAPSAHVVPPGYFNLEPYLFVTDTYGTFDSDWHGHSTPNTLQVNPLISFQIGLCNNIDLQTAPQMFYTRKEGKASTQFGDFPVGFDFQILKDRLGEWWPAIKIAVRETFPTGKYQKLNPNKNGTDGVGSGAYTTGFGLVFSRLFHLGGVHFLNSRLSFGYNIPSNVHVKGFNSYGGGHETRGTVRPGHTFSTIIGLEFTLALHWAFALDIANVYGNKTSFSGRRGTTSTGSTASVGGPSFDQVSLAPAIEYNFNESMGIIAGAWFTVAGRNTTQFASGIIAFNWFTSYKSQKKKAKKFEFPQGGKFN